jgi:AAA+ ATPase superfamily predicted ATPase
VKIIGLPMKNLTFVGRKEELQDLRLHLKKKTSSLVVIQGRRRIGKSPLIQKFVKDFGFYEFAGIAPTPKTTAQYQNH